MFSIYIKNYLDPSTAYSGNISGATLIETEKKLYDIPNEYNSDIIFLEPKVSVEMGKTGSFEFKMESNNPYYNSLRQMKTIMRITYENITLFRGRVLTIDNTMYGEKTVHVEGDLAFLLDTFQESVKEESQVKKQLEDYLAEVVANHNALIETDKQFSLGQVPGRYSADIPNDMRIIIDSSIEDSKKVYDTNSWTQTMNALDSLTKQYGGYWRTRYENGMAMLDWFKNFYNPQENPQPIKIGSNLIDIGNTLEVNNLFTVIVPIGTRKGKSLYLTKKTGSKYMEVPAIVNEYSQAELNTVFHSREEYANAITNYGRIYKTVQFSNADNEETLFKYAKDWIKNNYHGGISSFSITALDLHMVGDGIRPYLVGDLVRVIYPNPSGGNNLEGLYTILKASYDLYNPESNQYTVGIPDMALSKTYGETKTSKGGGGGGAKSPTDKQSDGLGGLIDSLLDGQEDTQNNLMYKVWRFMDTGEWPDDDGEAKTNDTTTTNEDMDEEDKDTMWSLLRGDGIKSTLFDAVKGNFNNILTVGGSNTTQSLLHMAGGETGGTWGSSSPIILDGTTGDIISKKGTVSIQDLIVGYDWAGSGGGGAFINGLGQGIFRDLQISEGRIIVTNESSESIALLIRSNGGIQLTGSGGITAYSGNIETTFGDFVTWDGNFETASGNVMGASIGGNHVYTRYADSLGGDDLAAKAFVDCAASESNGVITFKFWGPNSSQSATPVKTVNFNMADTQFFKDSVEAAKAVTISASSSSTPYTEKGSNYTQIFTNVDFTSQRWYRFTVTAGTSTKRYAIFIK